MPYQKLINLAFQQGNFQLLNGLPPPKLTGGRLFIPAQALSSLSQQAFHDLAFYLRPGQLTAWAKLMNDSAASSNDRFVAESLLRNAIVAARGELALCQDTGTAQVQVWKDESVITAANDRLLIAAGISAAYKDYHLRSSQVAPLSFFEDYDTLNNLPAQIHLEACPDSPAGPSYRCLFVAKGGGSANKTALFQLNKAYLEETVFSAFLEEKIRDLGVAACPPYRIALVVGGSSPEENLQVLKLATTEILDGANDLAQLSRSADDSSLYRDSYWEAKIRSIGRRSGLGAQFGGTGLILEARVLRLARHAASLPVSIGLSCSAHRQILGFINTKGVFLEVLEKDPAGFLGSLGSGLSAAKPTPPGEVVIDLNQPWPENRRRLAELTVGSRLRLSGKLLVARDAAHARWQRAIETGLPLPAYLLNYPIYYAGPAATPPGRMIGSLGPTTAQRMDQYAESLMSRGAAWLTIAKGDRSAAWAKACQRYGAFYLACVGGAAALQSAENIVTAKVIDYPDLGMEAVRLIEVKDLAAFIVINDRGEDLYAHCR